MEIKLRLHLDLVLEGLLFFFLLFIFKTRGLQSLRLQSLIRSGRQTLGASP